MLILLNPGEGEKPLGTNIFVPEAERLITGYDRYRSFCDVLTVTADCGRPPAAAPVRTFTQSRTPQTQHLSFVALACHSMPLHAALLSTCFIAGGNSRASCPLHCATDCQRLRDTMIVLQSVSCTPSTSSRRRSGCCASR